MHKLILSHSISDFHFFESEFAKSDEIFLEGPADIVRHLVQFLYTGTVPKNLEAIALELYFVACRCDVWELTEPSFFCIINEWLQTMVPDNVVDIFIRAVANGCEDLVRYCRTIVKAKFSSLGQDDLAKLKAQPEALIRLLQHGDPSNVHGPSSS